MTEESDLLTLHLTLTSEPAAPRMPLKTSKSVTASQLRRQISETTKIPLSSLRVIVRGRLVADDETSMVESFKLEDGCVLHCMGKPVKEEEEQAASAVVASAVSTVSVGQPKMASSAGDASASTPLGNSLQSALAAMRTMNSPADYLTGVTTLDKILSNITSHPMEEKYRRVKVQNAAFQKRLGGLPGGDAVMKAVGFTVEPDATDGEASYVLHASADAWLNLMSCKSEVEQAVLVAKSATSSASPPTAASITPPAFAPPNAFPGWPVAGGSGANPLTNPAMQQAMTQMMSDPNQLQNMLQDPMVQNAMRSDPRFANDPMLRQTMESLASNPAMMSQLSQMMQNPEMQRQMQSMMGAAGTSNNSVGWGGTLGGNATGTTSNTSSANDAPPGNSAASDEDLTEEEMIAEAIRRSLQDG